MKKTELLLTIEELYATVEALLKENEALKLKKASKKPFKEQDFRCTKATQAVALFFWNNSDAEFRHHQVSNELKLTSRPRIGELRVKGYLIETGKDNRGYKYYRWNTNKIVPSLGAKL